MNATAAALPFPYDGPDSLRGPIVGALQRVVDPELALSIVDIGLVYAVSVAAKRLHVVLTMTSAACPVTDLIVEDVAAELERIAPPDVAVDVELAWAPPWSADRMSPRAKAFMGW